MRFVSKKAYPVRLGIWRSSWARKPIDEALHLVKLAHWA